ncbi:MAG: hemerythrin domain-containing protein [Planctomycetaceae bacterium]|nr:hemerythrin domain-containing protein [Planctomycetaceae bacterium]
MMNKKTNSHEHLQYLLDEHEEILLHIKELNDWCAELGERGLPKFGEMGTRVGRFRDLLAKHFEDEAQEGYFKPVLDESPGFCIMVPDFKAKHTTTLSLIDDFISRLKQPEPPFKNWSSALKEFEGLLTVLREHEDQEIKLVQEAFDKSSAKKC